MVNFSPYLKENPSPLAGHYMPGTEIRNPYDPFPLPGCVALRSLRAVKGNTNVGRMTKRWKPIPTRWLFVLTRRILWTLTRLEDWLYRW